MKICHRGHFTGISGYARATRAQARALIEAGLDLSLENNKKDHIVCSLDDFWKKELPARLVPDHKDADVIIWQETPEFYEPVAGKRNIASLCWETSKIPSVDLHNNPKNNWVKQLNLMTEAWVPCTHNKHVFETSGVTIPIHVVPYPMKMSDYDPATKPLYTRDPTFEVHAVSVFQWQPRKDPVGLLLGTYLAKAATRLLVKTYLSDPQEGASDILKKMRLVKKSFHATPSNVAVPIFEQLTDEQMPGLYASADVYITTSRGEGWCLPAVEAMAMGKPIIAPFGTAFKDFLRFGEPNATGIALLSYETPVIGMDWIPWYSPDQNWLQVDPRAVSTALDTLPALKKSGELQWLGTCARQFVSEHYNSEKIGAQMKQLLEN
jgi:glycosyltransferase involved in cell wall biosynthesis